MHKRSAITASTGFFIDGNAKLQKEQCFVESFALSPTVSEKAEGEEEMRVSRGKVTD